MHIVFLNTFEKVGSDREVDQAQLSICEQNGVWSVIWTVAAAEEQSVWFEGGSWEEMITAFRHGVAVRMGEGYTPIIDGMLEERRSLDDGSLYSMIQCYGETNPNEEIFEALREWRRKAAITAKKSAYLVATNRMLWMISSYVPQQAEELLQIPGWGETRQAAYGEDVLAITQKFERQTHFPLNWVAEALDPKQYTGWIYKQKENKYKLLMERQHQKRALLQAIAEGKNIDELLAEVELPRRDLMDRIEKLETEGYDMEPLIERELSQIPPAEQQQLWDALLTIGDRYLKPVLHQVYGEETMQGRGKTIDLLYDRLRLLRLRYRRTKSSQVS
ncbi:HRDC domain-containing protein [Paenibacillus albus]|uniref:Aldolase n=1 Tax=Paenibacillus albus TaxID=2495582 RepID=A0A3Q8XA47_9BACL|nr:HRDC domain-containing protein [Paenibacillus albus]AZN42824.1 aldolase [Paenibacillus albus]